ncbi:MAG: hypothetical protein ACFB2Z_10685 [Maricaulaceae bacterium]
MTDQWTYRFKINGFTPETLPLSRLLKYLEPLAKLFGSDAVHLIEVQDGSAAPAFWVDDAWRQRIHERLTAVHTDQGEPDARAAYAEINDLLNRDDTSALMEEADGAQVIAFPGRQDERPVLRGVREDGDFDGVVLSVGGKGSVVPIRMETFDGSAVANFKSERDVAKRLALQLFEPTRLYGTGAWSRSADGLWRLDSFLVRDFEPLELVSIPDAVARLREVGDSLPEDIAESLLRDRLDKAV